MVSRRSQDTAVPELVTTGQAAAALGVRSVNTVKRWVREGRLEGVRRGSRILVRMESLDRFRDADRSPDGAIGAETAGRTGRRHGKTDVLSELRALPKGADRAQREDVGARAIDDIRSRVRPVLRSQGISRAFLFGSVARGDVHLRSDVDIAVELPDDSTMDLVDFAGLALELEDRLGRKVDLVNLGTMKSGIRDAAAGEEVALL